MPTCVHRILFYYSKPAYSYLQQNSMLYVALCHVPDHTAFIIKSSKIWHDPVSTQGQLLGLGAKES